MKNTLDSALNEFGAELNPIYLKGRLAKSAKNTRFRLPASRTGSLTPSMRDQRMETLRRTVRKAPEVMVKITGGGRNMSKIKAHMDYISRNGRVELEDEQGLTYNGKSDVRDVRDAWRDGGHPIPYEGEGGPREAFNVMLSMPAGTDAEALKDAARAFATQQFKRHQYAFALHDDKKHHHVHITVKAMGLDGKRLNPRKGDLHRWRVAFAKELNARGIEANATPRKARGIVRKGQRQAVRGIAERNARSHRIRKHQAEALREARGGERHVNPAQDRISATRKHVVKGYGNLAKELAKGSAEDRELALQIVEFVRSMPQPSTAHEQRVEAYRQGREAAAAPNRERAAERPQRGQERF